MYYLEIQGLFKALNKFKGFSMLYKPCFPSPSLSSHASPFFTHLRFSLHSLLVPLPCPFLFPVLIYLPSSLPLLSFSCGSPYICLSFPLNTSPCFSSFSLLSTTFSLLFLLDPSLNSLSLLNPFFIASSSSLQLSSLLSSSPSSSLSFSLYLLFLFLLSPFSIFFFISSIFLFTFLSLFSSFLSSYILFFSSLPLPPSVFILPSYLPPILSSCYIPPSSSGPKITFSIKAPIRKLTKKVWSPNFVSLQNIH